MTILAPHEQECPVFSLAFTGDPRLTLACGGDLRFTRAFGGDHQGSPLTL